MLHREEKIAKIVEMVETAKERELGIIYAFVLALMKNQNSSAGDTDSSARAAHSE